MAHAEQGVADGQIEEGAEIDLDRLPTGAETWDQMQNRASVNIDAFLTQEVTASVTRLAPYGPNRDYPFAILPENTWHKFDHPLKFTNLRRAWAAKLDLHASDPLARLDDPTWYATMPYTMVKMGHDTDYEPDYQMGRVLFRQPVFIACSKHFHEIRVVDQKNKIAIGTEGMPQFSSPGGGLLTQDGQGMPTGFWRPPRVWMQCFYTRENYYDRLAGQTTRVIQQQTVDGEDARYHVRAMVIDGRYCLEVKKVNPDADPEQAEMNAATWISQITEQDDNAVVEVFPDDFAKDPVPPQADMPDGEYSTYKETTADYSFPYGKLLVWAQHSPGEQKLSGEGVGDADYWTSTVRPRLYKWRLRDDRSRLLGQAIRALESQNDITVAGSLTVNNTQQHVTNGLGFVDYPNRGRVAVVRIVYRFENGLQTELEVGREKARFGEIIPEEDRRLHQIETQLTTLTRSVNMGGQRPGSK